MAVHVVTYPKPPLKSHKCVTDMCVWFQQNAGSSLTLSADPVPTPAPTRGAAPLAVASSPSDEQSSIERNTESLAEAIATAIIGEATTASQTPAPAG